MEIGNQKKTIDFVLEKNVLFSLVLIVLFLIGAVQTVQLTGLYKSLNDNQQTLGELKVASLSGLSAAPAAAQSSAPSASSGSSGLASQVGGC